MKLTLSSLILVSLFIVSGCFLSSPASYSIIDINGIDFSTMSYNDEIDIALVNYYPLTGEISDSCYYFLVSSEPQNANIKDLYFETFNYIDRITANFPWDTMPPPVKYDHLYIVRCLDGFVKFKIVSIMDAQNYYNTEIRIFYEFTPDSTF